MANTVDVVSILLKLEQLRQFVTGAGQASSAISKIGDEAQQTGDQTAQAGKKAGVSWKSVAKWAGGAAVFYKAQSYIRGAVSATEDLGRATLAVSRTTGMDVHTASAWAAIAKERGIATKQLQVGFVTLSKQMGKAKDGADAMNAKMHDLNAQVRAVQEEGGKKAPAALSRLAKQMQSTQAQGTKAAGVLGKLGVSMAVIRKGNTNEVLNQVADGLAKTTNASDRARYAQQLFGRGGQALLPILMKGRKGIQEQMDVVEKYGDTRGVKTVGQLKELLANQRELGIAQQGMKVQLGSALMPILLQFTKLLTGAARALAPLTKNALLFKIALMAVVAAFIAYKVAMVAATIATTVFETAAAPVVLTTLAIVAGIAALIAIGYLLYKNWGTISAYAGKAWGAVKNAMAQVVGAFKAAFSWVKSNWPLLVGILAGPFGLAAVLIVRHLDMIKAVAQAVVDAIKRVFNDLVNFVKDIPGRITGALGKAGGVLGGV